mgnify:CR=1 FL=1
MFIKNILLSCISCLVLTGCYTQLAMFYPEPEIEREKEEQFYETYSRAVPRLGVNAYAQDGAGTPLSLSYSTMYNRFRGFGNKYNYYNPYYYGGNYYEYDSYYLAGYTMYIPVNTGERKIRTFSTSRDDNSYNTNLNITRTRTTTNSSSNSGYSNSSNVSVTRGTSSSSSSNSSGGRRVTKRK